MATASYNKNEYKLEGYIFQVLLALLFGLILGRIGSIIFPVAGIILAITGVIIGFKLAAPGTGNMSYSYYSYKKTRNNFIMLALIVLVTGAKFKDGIEFNFTRSAKNVIVEEEDVLTATITADRLNLRTGASVQSDVIKVLLQGTIVIVKGDAVSGWTPVEHEGDEGFVSTPYIELNQ